MVPRPAKTKAQMEYSAIIHSQPCYSSYNSELNDRFDNLGTRVSRNSMQSSGSKPYCSILHIGNGLLKVGNGIDLADLLNWEPPLSVEVDKLGYELLAVSRCVSNGKAGLQPRAGGSPLRQR
jgi:hypothetical protein